MDHRFNENTSVAGGKRKDEDLLAAYEANRKKNNETYKIVKTKKELLNINSTDDFVLGLFNDDHLKYELEKLGTNETEPTLTDMVKKAVEILSKNKNGFYLFVEGNLYINPYWITFIKKQEFAQFLW